VPEKNPQAQSAPDDAEEAPVAQPGGDATAEVPLNRAARRGHAKEQQKPAPGHVGPRLGHTPAGRSPRSHTKRRSG
jgi:hypothetical protein